MPGGLGTVNAPDLRVETDTLVPPTGSIRLTGTYTEVAAAAEPACTGSTLQTPVLWPEHFDVGITLDKVNYGVSPGDDDIPEPYAYVGPWTPRKLSPR